jgi:hypothetical protein
MSFGFVGSATKKTAGVKVSLLAMLASNGIAAAQEDSNLCAGKDWKKTMNAHHAVRRGLATIFKKKDTDHESKERKCPGATDQALSHILWQVAG